MSDSTNRPASSAREVILTRIRTELRDAGEAAVDSPIARNYRRNGSLDRAACVDLLIDRLRDYDAAVVQVEGAADLREAIAASLRASGEQRVVVDAAFPREWLPAGLQSVVDDSVAIDKLEGVQAVLTTSEIAVASTGTIVLKHSGAQGRRAITLLPDHHLCIVRRDQVVELLPEALAALDPLSTSPITTISGPSATSDIEMTRIRGVHGPRRLTVIVYGPTNG
jgi:L-lactate dehydrogenase complex protein LldG